MSAPNTDLDRQERNHKGPLTGIRIALLAVGALFIAFFIWNFAANDGIEGPEQVIDGRTGEVEPVATELTPPAAER